MYKRRIKFFKIYTVNKNVQIEIFSTMKFSEYVKLSMEWENKE